MYNPNVKKEILEALVETPFIFRVCKKFGISRSTFYEWIKDDPKFAQGVTWSLKEGKRSMLELGVTSLMKKVTEGHFPAIRYYLQYNHGDYRPPERITSLSVALARMRPKPKKGYEHKNPVSRWHDSLTTTQEKMLDLLYETNKKQPVDDAKRIDFINMVIDNKFESIATASEFLEWLVSPEQEASPPSE